MIRQLSFSVQASSNVILEAVGSFGLLLSSHRRPIHRCLPPKSTATLTMCNNNHLFGCSDDDSRLFDPTESSMTMSPDTWRKPNRYSFSTILSSVTSIPCGRLYALSAPVWAFQKRREALSAMVGSPYPLIIRSPSIMPLRGLLVTRQSVLNLNR
jgi:hypothetical protein